MNKHFDWIDYAKGIAILLVVLGHSFPDASAVGGGCPRTQFEKNSSSKMAGKTINLENNHVDVMNKDTEICLNSDTLLPGNSVGGVFGQPGGGCPRTQFEKNSSSKMAGKTINSENNHVDVMNKDTEICLNSDTLLPGNSVGGVFGRPGGVEMK